jgi:adenylate cyclase
VPLEHERRFLVAEPPDLRGFEPQVIMQGYLLNDDGYTVRVRRVSTPRADGTEYGSVTVKGPRSRLGDRQEEEFILEDLSLAGQLLRRCRRKLLKRRYALPDTWVVDVFDWANEGLVIAELEAETPADVGWKYGGSELGREVTAETAFNNEWLAYRPWGTWTTTERANWTA